MFGPTEDVQFGLREGCWLVGVENGEACPKKRCRHGSDILSNWRSKNSPTVVASGFGSWGDQAKCVDALLGSMLSVDYRRLTCNPV